MNTPNPLIPQGTLSGNQSKSRFRIAVFTVISLHVIVLLGALNIAGCKKTSDQNASNGTETGSTLPPFTGDTNPPVPTGNTGAPPSTLLTPGTTGIAAIPTNPIISPVPQPVPNPPENALAGGMTDYTITKGDSFYVIGKKYHVTTKAIEEANPGIDSKKLKVGQKIKVPAPTAPTAAGSTLAGTAGSGGTAAGPGETIYTVKSGDNLWTLSRKFGLKDNVIRNANNLTSATLKVGQKLRIPAKGTAAPSSADTTPASLPGTATPSTPVIPGPGPGVATNNPQ